MEMETIWRRFDTLPAEAKREVVDFVDFLHTRYQRPLLRPDTKKTSLRDEPFIGMWKDREDLRDSVAWVREIRQREWGG